MDWIGCKLWTFSLDWFEFGQQKWTHISNSEVSCVARCGLRQHSAVCLLCRAWYQCVERGWFCVCWKVDWKWISTKIVCSSDTCVTNSRNSATETTSLSTTSSGMITARLTAAELLSLFDLTIDKYREWKHYIDIVIRSVIYTQGMLMFNVGTSTLAAADLLPVNWQLTYTYN